MKSGLPVIKLGLGSAESLECITIYLHETTDYQRIKTKSDWYKQFP